MLSSRAMMMRLRGFARLPRSAAGLGALVCWGLALGLAALLLAGCAPPAPLTTIAPATITQAPPTRAPTQAPPATFTAAPRLTPTLAPTATSNPPTETAPTPLPPTATPLAPTPDATAKARQVRLPILMYHYVEPWPAEATELRRGLTVTPEAFAAQMGYLAEHGYVTVSLYDLAEALALGRPLPGRAVVLTFDDGYRGLLNYALPVMQPLGFTGTIFAITEFTDLEMAPYLTWDHLRALAALGWRIEPHTKTHLQLAGQSRETQLYQMLGAIESVEAHVGARPRFFCYPAGKYDEVTLQLAQDLQLWGAVTTGGGRLHDFAGRFTTPRMRIDGRGSLRDFVQAVEGDLP